MEELKINSGIKKIAIRNEEDELITTLRINVADAEVIEKFARVINDLNSISERSEAEADKMRTEAKSIGETDNSEISMEDISKAVDINRVRVKYIKEIINTLDGLFGEGTMEDIFGDIVPDEMAVVEFVEGIIPVMNKLFDKRLELSRKKYNTKRRGARA